MFRYRFQKTEIFECIKIPRHMNKIENIISNFTYLIGCLERATSVSQREFFSLFYVFAFSLFSKFQSIKNLQCSSICWWLTNVGRARVNKNQKKAWKTDVCIVLRWTGRQYFFRGRPIGPTNHYINIDQHRYPEMNFKMNL
jgi:hypothetical protein